jgi:translocation and assembly module TamB
MEDNSPPNPQAVLTTLTWPLKVHLPWHIDQLHWAGPPALSVQALSGRYDFDGQHHQLKLQPFELAQGQYSLEARLQAAAPMALDMQLQGQVQTQATARTRALTLQGSASVQGHLSGTEAQLQLVAHLSPASQTASGMLIDLQARLHPWQVQPVQDAQGQWQQVDLALLWPGAPQTRLSGQLSLTPDATGWPWKTEWTNANSGPWDQQRLPLSQLNAQGRYQQGLWQIQQLDARLAAGQVQGQGQQSAAGWSGQVQVKGLIPSLLHTALAPDPVQGQIQAQETGKDGQQVGVRFGADLSSVPTSLQGPRSASPTLRWEHLHLQGLWQTAQWDIQALDLRAADARVQGQFKLQPPQGRTSWAAQGQLQLNVPGLNAQAQGQLAAQTGAGSVQLDVQDAALSQAWLSRWPGAAEGLQGLQATGPAKLQAQWQGGYAQNDTSMQASIQLPRLARQTRAAEIWHIHQARIQAQGTLQKLDIQAQSRLQLGRWSAQWQTRLSAAAKPPEAGSSRLRAWQGQILSATLAAQNGNTAPSWHAQLNEAVSWQWSADAPSPTGRWGAGALVVKGPSPGQPQLSWSPGQWSAPLPGQGAKAELSARLKDWPLAWLSGLISPDIHSDVLLQGELNWTQQDRLRVQAVLERSKGDLRIAADGAPGQQLKAGLRTARVQLQVDGEDVRTQLQWDSEQMGQAQAQAQTRLSASAQGWSWPEQAPLSGQLQANLPRVGAWSLLAPPGWRVQGTLDANVTLSGTRAQPQWQGRLQADKLAVRSAVQGIEFSQGQLRAQLQGQQVELTQLSLRGAGAQGGELQAKGLVKWLAPSQRTDPAPAQAWGDVEMALQMQIQGLRVSNRADRRLAISGDIKAQMQQGKLQLRGQVQADQALFILPEDNTPTLGSDVRVMGADKPLSTGNANATGSSWLGTPDVQVSLDLGPDFQVRGLGLNTRLAGQLTLVSNAASQGQPRLTGQVRTEGGRYKAYGQQLDIDNGLLRFSGPYDNPSLDILAIRPNLSQRVGVLITGTALLPRIRLYSDPDMPDADKLAWLVMGRSAAGGGAESAVLQQAALALLGGNGKTLSGELAGALGLDEISLAQGSRSDATATGAAVTLGKRLSKDIYIVYETSLRGTFGSFYVFYDLSRRLTLRAQTGQDNALDLIYTIRKD